LEEKVQAITHLEEKQDKLNQQAHKGMDWLKEEP
jgi:hypothetical protein